MSHNYEGQQIKTTAQMVDNHRSNGSVESIRRGRAIYR